MRPASIQWFERVFLAALAVNLLSTALNWGAVAALVRDPTLAQLGLGRGFVIGSMVLSFAMYLLLWYFIARRASVVAMWVFVVLTGLSVLNFLQALAARPLAAGIVPLLAIVVLVMQVYAAWLLFRPDARDWLKRGGADSGSAGPVS